jgi:hypothetical protein
VFCIKENNMRKHVFEINGDTHEGMYEAARSLLPRYGESDRGIITRTTFTTAEFCMAPTRRGQRPQRLQISRFDNSAHFILGAGALDAGSRRNEHLSSTFYLPPAGQRPYTFDDNLDVDYNACTKALADGLRFLDELPLEDFVPHCSADGILQQFDRPGVSGAAVWLTEAVLWDRVVYGNGPEVPATNVDRFRM